MKISGFLLLLIAIFSVSTHAVTITGTVKDAKDNPIPFCSVYLMGTTIGTTANIEGQFAFEIGAGDYEVVFRSIGYKLSSRKIKVENENLELNIILENETYQLKEAVINASSEDPAYTIIRKAIRMRKKYLDEVDSYSCRSYVKSTQKLINYPKKFLGQTIDFGDQLDTVSKILYLSESVANLSFQKPDKVKEEMISSKVSGDNRSFSFNKSADMRVSFYQNLIYLGNLTKRGLVSPVSSTAMLYYDYRLEGTFFQNGETVNKIKVIPKRKHDPVFTGDIYILDDSWRIHSLDLFITKDQQVEFIDTLRISETYIPVEKNAWMLMNCEFNFEFSAFGFRGKGIILGVFSDYNVHPDFPKHFFDNEVLKINRDANKKDTVYWDNERPVPLTLEENRDYIKRDSLFVNHNTRQYMDSLDRINNKFSFTEYLFQGYGHENTFKHTFLGISPLIQSIQFNTAEGWVISLLGRYVKSNSKEKPGSIALIADSRYGFSNTHFNGNILFRNYYNAFRQSVYTIAAGSEVSDFNGRAHFAPLVNTGYTLLAKKNYLKIYERRFGSVKHKMEITNGFVLLTGAEYADRIPLANTTDFAWINPGHSYLSNDPLHAETDSLHFKRNQSFTIDVAARIRFRQKYIMRPYEKSGYSSRYPELTFGYKKAIPFVAGSDVEYDLVNVTVKDKIRMGLFGGINYSISYGNFLRSKKMEFMDFHHFNGNKTFYSDFSLNDFALLDYYRLATSRDYVELHGEYNMGGLVLNKIPFLRKLKLSEIVGAHYFYASYSNTSFVKNYYETSFGIEKLRVLRADFVLGFDGKGRTQTGFVIGLKLNISDGSIDITD